MNLVGTTVGNIRIEGVLGEGGMGEVYSGHDEKLRRTVALKAIRSEHALNPEMKSRFLKEARVLSRLDHPNICQIFDYIEGEDCDLLVLELIEGRNLNEALASSLEPALALRIAQQIADVLVAAHAEGVVHRDLKPANVMLTSKGEVKVLDFGLARSLGEETRASPAQLAASAELGQPEGDADGTETIIDLPTDSRTGDPRTADLRTGDSSDGDATLVRPVSEIAGPDSEAPDLSAPDLATPRAPAPEAPAPEVPAPEVPAPEDAASKDAAGEESPSRADEETLVSPSHPAASPGPALDPGWASVLTKTKVGSVLGTPQFMSPEQARGETATPASDMYSFGLLLQHLFTGKPPYEQGSTAQELVHRAQNADTLPVAGLDRDLTALINSLKALELTQRPTAVEAAQRLRWIRGKPQRRLRNLIAAAVVLFILGGSIKYTLDLRREKAAAVAAAELAEREAETARQTTEFLVDLFEVSDPEEARGNTITAREILDQGATRITNQLEGEPLTQARLLHTIGRVYLNLGLYEDAAPLLERSLENRQQQLGDEHLEVAATLLDLAGLNLDLGRYGEAKLQGERSLAIREKNLGPDDPEVAASLQTLASIYSQEGMFEEAEPLVRRALEIDEKALGQDDLEVSKHLNTLAIIHYFQGNYLEGAPLLERALAMQEAALGSDHPEVASTVTNLSSLYFALGDHAAAEPLVVRSIELAEKLKGPDHPSVAGGLNNLAELYKAEGKYEAAEPVLLRALASHEKVLGPSNVETSLSLHNLGELYKMQGQTKRAEPLFRRALAIREATLNADHPWIASSLHHLGELCASEERYEEAEAFLKRSLAIREKVMGPEHPATEDTAQVYGEVRGALGRGE